MFRILLDFQFQLRRPLAEYRGEEGAEWEALEAKFEMLH